MSEQRRLTPIPGGKGTSDLSEYSSVNNEKLETRGAGPYDPGMEARMQAVELGLKHVETRVTSLETKVDGLDTRLRGVEVKLGEISGKLDVLTATMGQMLGKLPSWWQMPAVVGATAILVIGIIKLFAPN